MTLLHAEIAGALLLELRRVAGDRRAGNAIVAELHRRLVGAQAAARRSLDQHVALNVQRLFWKLRPPVPRA